MPWIIIDYKGADRLARIGTFARTNCVATSERLFRAVKRLKGSERAATGARFDL
jgi:hypothetical protein